MRRLQRTLDHLGPAGVAGIGVLLFCAPFYFTALAPAQKELQRIERQRSELQRREAERRAAAQRPAPLRNLHDTGDPAVQLARFRALFPPADALSGELARLYGHARAARLQLQQGEYRLEPQANGLTSYRVTLPVQGSYAQIRQFVGRVLARMPNTSLDALRFERKNADAGRLDAEIRLSIHLRTVANEGGT